MEDPPYSPRLLAALGGVAAASADLDLQLRTMLDTLIGSDHAFILFDGQNTEWLLRACKTILGERDPYFNRYSEGQHQEFLALGQRANLLRELRNFVIHGHFRVSRAKDPEDIRPRPWGNWDAEKPLSCMRARNYRGLDEQWFTVSDVERLARELEDVTSAWESLFRNMHPPARWDSVTGQVMDT